MDLKHIAEALHVPLPILATGRKGKPMLKLVKPAPKSGPVDNPKQEG